MNSSQSVDEETEKSKGQAPDGVLTGVGKKHAIDRLEGGLKLDQLVSEYRALRAGVLRLWEQTDNDDKQGITRFNEAIDETLAESAAWYSKKVAETREQFLDILGHDLRNPLGSIIVGATLLTNSHGADTKNAAVAARILNSAGRMNRMVNDLLDLTRSRLGAGIPIIRKPMNLGPVCEQVVAELQTIHPDCHLQFEQKGDLQGDWDSDRLTQVISNLVANGVQYGCKAGPITVAAEALGEEVVVRVHNDGPPIPQNAIRKIFEPMVRHAAQHGDTNATGLGLGLYIARAVLLAHGGTIAVSSNDTKGTTFTVRIPRRDPKSDSSSM
jgi:signal transduction histidine kinase